MIEVIVTMQMDTDDEYEARTWVQHILQTHVKDRGAWRHGSILRFALAPSTDPYSIARSLAVKHGYSSAGHYSYRLDTPDSKHYVMVASTRTTPKTEDRVWFAEINKHNYGVLRVSEGVHTLEEALELGKLYAHAVRS